MCAGQCLTFSGIRLLAAMRTSYRCLAVLLLPLPGLAAACWEEAARQHAVPATLLYAIAQAESALNPQAVNRSHYPVTKTIDIGYMQVNSNAAVLKNLGITEQQLFDPCTNIHTGARILAEKFARYGRSWEAVGAFNASCVTMAAGDCSKVRMRYAWRVYRFLVRHAPATGPRGREASQTRIHLPG